jgi:alpha-D-ribose 1-methylphosphonate 5-triphosphate synthase subunit PhnH
MSTATLLTAFNNTTDESQCVFRSVLKAMSEPGRLVDIKQISSMSEDEALFPPVWAIAQTLFDHDTEIFVSQNLATDSVLASLKFYTGAKVTATQSQANFALLNLTDWLDSNDFSVGTWEHPQHSCTLIIQVPSLAIGPQLGLSGPGIKQKTCLSIPNFQQSHINLLITNHNLYPCGVDFIFCTPTQIVCIPRSTHIELISQE